MGRNVTSRVLSEKQKGNANLATLAVARKLVAYLTAVDRGQRNFQAVATSNGIAA